MRRGEKTRTGRGVSSSACLQFAPSLWLLEGTEELATLEWGCVASATRAPMDDPRLLNAHLGTGAWVGVAVVEAFSSSGFLWFLSAPAPGTELGVTAAPALEA